MRRSLCFVFAFALLFSASLAAQNVFVLPTASSSNVTVFGADPFSQLAGINVTQSGQFVFAGPNGKYYIVSNVGNGNPTVAVVTQNADGSFGAVRNVASFSGAVAADMSPDGKHLVVVSSNAINIIDTTADTSISVPFGGQIVDFAISADSSRVFVLNATTQISQVIAVDMKTGSSPASGAISGTPSAISVGPTGRVYVSTAGALLEVDPTSLITTRSIPVAGRPGKVLITPNAGLGVAVNQNPTITGTAAFVFDLNLHTILSSIPSAQFSGAILSQIVPVGNNRAIAYSSTAQSLFDVALNPVNVSPLSVAPGGTVSAFTLSNDVASGSHAGTQFLFFTSNNNIYRYDLIANQITGQQNLNATPTVIAYAAQAITNGTPAAILTYGDNQTITLNTASGPLTVRVVDAQGRPLAGVNVSFGVTTSGVTLSSTSAVTNNQGLASTTLTSTVAGSVTVNVTAGSLTTTFTVNVGGGPGGPSASGCLTILTGQGQVVLPNLSAIVSGSLPLTIQCLDSTGKPETNQSITFAIISGPPNAQILSYANGIAGTGGQNATISTDTNGQAQVIFINPCGIVSGPVSCPGFTTTTVEATAPDGSVVTFYETTTDIPEQADATLPSVITLSSGAKKLGAISANVSTADPGTSPLPIPFVGMRIVSADGTASTAARCDGAGGFALSSISTNQFGDQSAKVTCDLIATGTPGTYALFAEIGGNLLKGPFTLIITPGAPASLNIISGNTQAGPPGQKLATPLVVSVTDPNGNVLPNTAVTFAVVSGSATLSATSVNTDSQGRASTTVTLGSTPGVVQIKATAGNATQTFSETIVTPASAIVLVSGGGQSALVGTAFAAPLIAKVVDLNGNGVGGITVSFVVTSGSAIAATPQVVTNAQGIASTTLTAGATGGPVVITVGAGAFSTTASLTVVTAGPSNIVFLNGAGFTKGISPGAIVAIQGVGLVPNPGVFVPGNIIGPLPTSFQGISVTFNNVPAPIFSESNVNGVQQVVVQVPYEVAGASSVNVTIATAGGGSTTISNVPLQPYAPGIFETTAFGQRQVVATHADGSYVSPSNPAHRGENITVYLTGLGQTTPASLTNSAGIPGQRVTATVVAGINNVGVPIVNDANGNPMIVAAPGLVGVYALTLQVPTNAASGNDPINIIAYDAANNPYFAQGSILPVQ